MMVRLIPEIIRFTRPCIHPLNQDLPARHCAGWFREWLFAMRLVKYTIITREKLFCCYTRLAHILHSNLEPFTMTSDERSRLSHSTTGSFSSLLKSTTVSTPNSESNRFLYSDKYTYIQTYTHTYIHTYIVL